jgi:rhodanese-related sulfurtransferase
MSTVAASWPSGAPMLFRRTPGITPEEAMQRVAAGELTLVDVRETAELRAGRPGGALHIPLRQLPGRLTELHPDRPVAFLCRSGTRSSQAARLATKAGYEALNVRGGLLAWSRANLPLARQDGKPGQSGRSAP